MKFLLIFVVTIAGVLAIGSTFAADAKAPTDLKAAANAAAAADAKNAPADSGSKSQRSKSLSFDDSVVEGLNQNNKDSLEMVEKRDGRNRQHLYQKRADFKPEIKQFPSEMGYSP